MNAKEYILVTQDNYASFQIYPASQGGDSWHTTVVIARGSFEEMKARREREALRTEKAMGGQR